jgi:hypothetical protein
MGKFTSNGEMWDLHVGLNMAIAIALHNIPKVQNSVIQLLSLDETCYLRLELLPHVIALGSLHHN